MKNTPPTETLELDDLVVHIIRSRRKTLSIEINHKGLVARAPMRMRHSSISEFVQHKRQWIDKHLNRIPAPMPPLDLITGAQLALNGESLYLNVIPDTSGAPKITVRNGRRELRLPVKASHLKIETSIKNKLRRWYKNYALTQLEDRRQFFAQKMAIPNNKNGTIKVREYKRRWGSCDANGALSFNWRIIMAPPQVMDYVVVHELAHCYEFNHSRRFWNIVEQQLPDWRTQQDWLQYEGAKLYRF